MKLTTDLCLVQRLRMFGAVFEVLHRDKLALIITIKLIIIIINTKYKSTNEELHMLQRTRTNHMKTATHTKTRHLVNKSRISGVLKKWESKLMVGQYIRSVDKQLVSEEKTLLLLSRGDMKAETESVIMAIQEQALKTKYHATKLLRTETESKRRLLQQFD